MRVVVLSVTALLAVASAKADTILLLGPGSQKCSTWNLARTPPISDTDIHEQHRRLDWALGYLGGSAQWRDRKLLNGVTSDDVERMVNVYCAANPDASIYWAADAVAEVLAAARKPIS